MKLKFWIIILILGLAYSCQIENNLSGYYSVCHNGEYMEVYFKQDSMRVASENEWIKLSEWRKIEIKNDTLYFESFGEWRENWKSKIKYINRNKTQLHNLVTDSLIDLVPFETKLNFENPTEFWKDFNNRYNSKNCK